MTLSSLKNMSIVHTPPEGRLPVEVTVAKKSEKITKEAIQKELERGGQIYYLHNRIGTIELVVKQLQKLAPKAKIQPAHAKLKEEKLIGIMDDFREGKFDILVSTTIIENGLDIPNVNTIIVEDATRLGLGQAYQLKGRVGRSTVAAHAYFLYSARSLKGKAKMRLEALKEASALGSGYRIALRDMEIRGAGNILGKEQSGSVNAVGLNLYCQMLSEAMEKIKGKVI
tara:strand:- start:7 stop:687 length:681 start_codon:yes stop_codon:yes gene_type:complete